MNSDHRPAYAGPAIPGSATCSECDFCLRFNDAECVCLNAANRYRIRDLAQLGPIDEFRLGCVFWADRSPEEEE